MFSPYWLPLCMNMHLSAQACALVATVDDQVSGAMAGLAGGITAARAALCAAVMPIWSAGSVSPPGAEPPVLVAAPADELEPPRLLAAPAPTPLGESELERPSTHAVHRPDASNPGARRKQRIQAASHSFSKAPSRAEGPRSERNAIERDAVRTRSARRRCPCRPPASRG